MPAGARSLADELRLRSDEELRELFALRPDLLRPVPKSFADLALHANSAASTLAALDDLNRAELAVLEACCALAGEGRFSARDVAHGLDRHLATVESIVFSLHRRLLLWGANGDLRVPSAVREAMGRTAAGLDPTVRRGLPAVRAALRDPDALRAELAAAPRHIRAGVMAAAWQADAAAELEEHGEAAPLAWLTARGLLVRDDLGQPRLPREVALILRHGVLLDDVTLDPPPAVLRGADEAAADQRAGHEADQFLRDLDRLLAALAAQPWTRQANSTIPVRDIERIVTATGLSPARLGLLTSLACAAGALDADADGRLRPTTAAPELIAGARSARWARMAATWLRLPGSVPEPARVLLARPVASIVLLRRLVLTALAAGSGFDVARWLSWHRPRLQPDPQLLDELLAEAEALGFAVGAVPSAVTRNLRLPADAATLAAEMEPLLPPLTERVILQADLTATALGPLEPAVERRLARVASWESGGAATVFRFGPESVRRGLAAGEGAAELLAWLARVSATDMPQALQVLIEDQARLLPRLSVSAARSVIRCSPQDAEAVLSDPALADLGLRAVGPGVVVAQVLPDELGQRLRAAGHAVLDAEPTAATLPPPPTTPPPPGPTATRVIETLRTIERREEAAPLPPREVTRSATGAILTGLAEANRAHRRIWLAFADESGSRITHLVEPLALENGDVCAFDVTAGEIRTIPLERIVGMAAVEA